MRDQCRQKENRMEEYDKTLDSNSRREEQEIEEKENQKLEDYGQMTLEGNQRKRKIHLLSIIGEVEGHENLSGNSKQPSMIMCFLNWLSWRMMIR